MVFNYVASESVSSAAGLQKNEPNKRLTLHIRLTLISLLMISCNTLKYSCRN